MFGPLNPKGTWSNILKAIAKDATIVVSTVGRVARIARAAITGDVSIPAGSNTSTIGSHAVTNAKFRQGAAVSVVGVTGNALADVADIASGGNNYFLGSNGSNTAISFQAISYSMITSPPQLANTLASSAHKWLNSYNGGTGNFTQTQPDASDLTGLAASATTDTTNAANISSGMLPLARVPAVVNGCRLYVSSGNPFDPSASTSTIYFGPAFHSQVTWEDGSGNLYEKSMSEISKALSALTNNSVYDVYYSDHSGAWTLTKWSGINTPPTRGSDAAGRDTKSGDTSALWLGIFETISTSATRCDNAFRGMSNAYNQVLADLVANDTAASWTSASTTYVTADGNTSDGVGRIRWVQAYPRQAVPASYAQNLGNSGSGNYSYAGLQLDATGNAITQPAGGVFFSAAAAAQGMVVVTITVASSSVGDHYLQKMVKVNAGTGTFYGSGTSGYAGSAVNASIMW